MMMTSGGLGMKDEGGGGGGGASVRLMMNGE